VPDAQVLRDPGVNFGIWDVPNRPLTGGPGAYAVNGGPLRCFHFGGFDPERPDILSRHQDRVDLAGHPVLAGLLRDYASELLAAGHTAAAQRRPAVGTPLMRRLYREGRAAGELREPLTSPAGEAELEAWLREPATRYLFELYRARPDLRAAFPDVGAELVGWARMAGAHEHALLDDLLYASSERAGAGSLE
jgi:hypothetical protein